MAPPTTPTTAISMIKSMIEKRKPTIAPPLGLLNNPIKDRRNPRNHITHPSTGIQDVNRPMMANTNPAVPQPLLLF